VADADPSADLTAEVERLRAENGELRGLVGELRNRISELESKLGRTSRNSSVPPSTDPNSTREEAQQSRAQRRAAARKRGKQPGSEGRHLAQVAVPDHCVVHPPSVCAGCGGDLADAEVVGVEKRQVFDLPPATVEVTEHVRERRVCPCGCVTAGVFPAEATAPACWGPRVRALGLYLTHRQHIPFERAAEMMSDVLGAPVSTGFLAGLATEADRRLAPFIGRVRELLAASPVIHADETSIRVSSKSWWLHVMAGTGLTLLVCHRRRGRDAIDAIDVLPGYRGVIVHDGLSAYDYLDQALHAQCNAHVLRHLAKSADHADTAAWAQHMTEVLLEAAAAAQRCRELGWAAVPANTERRLRRRYRAAVAAAFESLPPGPMPRRKNTGGFAPHQRDTWNLAVRLRDDEPDILRFLTDTRIGFTNNDAERPLRPAKLHDKISGTFRSEHHAKAFATVRSYLGTAAKHHKNIFQVLIELFTTGPWLPPQATPA
jgi:transposase